MLGQLQRADRPGAGVLGHRIDNFWIGVTVCSHMHALQTRCAPRQAACTMQASIGPSPTAHLQSSFLLPLRCSWGRSALLAPLRWYTLTTRRGPAQMRLSTCEDPQHAGRREGSGGWGGWGGNEGGGLGWG